jgi:Protein of unknown function (DUF4012)
MSIKPKPQSEENEFSRMTRIRDLESPLASVIEQDGVVLLTPVGIRTRARRPKKRKVLKNKFCFKAPLSALDTESQVEEMDMKAIACVVDVHDPPQAVCVAVNLKPHARSEYVVSLQDCFVGPDLSEDRVLPDEHLDYSREYTMDSAPMQALTSASLSSAAEPWMVNTQKENIEERGLLDSMRKSFRHVSRSFLRPVERVAEQSYEEVEEDKVQQEPVLRRINVKSFVLAFLGLAFIAVVPAFALTTYKTFAGQSGAIEQKGSEAAMALAAIAPDDDLSVSMQQLEMASAKFREASMMLDESKLLAASAAAVQPDKYRGARALLEVGEKTSDAAKILSLGFSKVFDKEKRPLIERIEVLGAHADAALPILQDAERASLLVSVDQVPDEYKEAIQGLPAQIMAAKETIRELKLVSDALVGFLGKDELRNYLLVFQNDSELRPSGGFMGSIAEVRMLNGELHSIYVPEGGPYDLKSQLTARVQSPQPMHLINPLWQFQDANWFADFYKTASRINWFWSKSGQPTLDGIIAVNASFMEDILEVTGPIEMPEYNKTITAENFYLETQKSVELEYDKEENKPKKFIGDLFDQLLVRVKGMSKDEWLKMAAAASEGLSTKDIQMAMFRPEEQDFVEQFGWSGSFKETNGDFLAIIESNIAGQKTDRVVKESVLHEVNIAADGSVENKVHLNRVHEGTKNEVFYGVRNVSYVRFYLPKGTELLSAEGFLAPPEKLFKKPLDTDSKDPVLAAIEETAKPGPGSVWTAVEDDYMVVGGWLQLDPGRSQDVIITYRLPFTISEILASMDEDMPDPSKSEQLRAAYLMLYTSQSGKSRELTQVFNVDPKWQIEWQRGSVNNASESQNVMVWDRDRVSALLFNQK